MKRLDDEQQAAKSEAPEAVTPRESAMAAAIGANYRSGLPQLFLVNENLHLRLAATNGAVIGRKAGIYSQFLTQFNYISGTHAELHYSTDIGWSIEDKNSSNGTYINGQRLQPSLNYALHNNDLLQLANIEFRIEISKR